MLGSREQLCIHPEVKKQESNHLQVGPWVLLDLWCGQVVLSALRAPGCIPRLGRVGEGLAGGRGGGSTPSIQWTHWPAQCSALSWPPH